MGLFNTGQFTLHSGSASDFKIDCDALAWADLQALAQLISRKMGPFRRVEGVPTGGLRLAQALEEYASHDEEDLLLIVDDVLTSGSSMEEHRAGREAIGAVIFARRWPKQHWIEPLFIMPANPF